MRSPSLVILLVCVCCVLSVVCIFAKPTEVKFIYWLIFGQRKVKHVDIFFPLQFFKVQAGNFLGYFASLISAPYPGVNDVPGRAQSSLTQFFY